jgi:hypothetical protein
MFALLSLNPFSHIPSRLSLSGVFLIGFVLYFMVGLSQPLAQQQRSYILATVFFVLDFWRNIVCNHCLSVPGFAGLLRWIPIWHYCHRAFFLPAQHHFRESHNEEYERRGTLTAFFVYVTIG